MKDEQRRRQKPTSLNNKIFFRCPAFGATLKTRRANLQQHDISHIPTVQQPTARMHKQNEKIWKKKTQ
jgi:hypothetical protein